MCYSKLRAGRFPGIAGYDGNLSPPRLPSDVAVHARLYGDSGGRCLHHRCVTNRTRGDTEKLSFVAHMRLGKPGLSDDTAAQATGGSLRLSCCQFARRLLPGEATLLDDLISRAEVEL